MFYNSDFNNTTRMHFFYRAYYLKHVVSLTARIYSSYNLSFPKLFCRRMNYIFALTIVRPPCNRSPEVEAPLRNFSNGNTSSTLFHIGADGTRNIGRSHSNTHPRYLQEGGGRIMYEPQTYLARVLYTNDRTSKPLTFPS